MTEQPQPAKHALLQVSFSGSLPSQLADLHSLREDFQFAKDCAAAYSNLHMLKLDDTPRRVLGQALWTAAVIAYRRGFISGKAQLASQASRLRIPKNWLDNIEPQYRKAHEEILAVANQQMAHYTGAQDTYGVVALLMPPPLPRELAGTAVMKIGLGAPTDERVIEFGRLCHHLIEGLDARLMELSEQFKAFVEAQNIDDLYEDPTRINEQPPFWTS